MNRFLLIISCAIFILPSSPAFSCDGFEQDMAALENIVMASIQPAEAISTAPFAREFLSVEEAKSWAETSTLGGGRIEERNFLGQDFIFAYRSYTSGVKSSDAAIYMKIGPKWKFIKANSVIIGYWITAERQDDIYYFRPEGKTRTLMTLEKVDMPRL